MRVAEFKMRLFVFFADKLLKWGRRVEQEAGYVRHDRANTHDRSLEPFRPETDREAPPEHWARLVKSVPPPHWLELLRRAAEEEQFFKDGAAQEPVVLAEPEREPSAVETYSSEEQPRESPPKQTPRNRTDYPGDRQPIRDQSRIVIPAVTPARFLDRLRFAAEPLPTNKPDPVYVPGKQPEAAQPRMNLDGHRAPANEREAFRAPAAASSASRGQANFPVGEVSSQSNFLSFVEEKSSAPSSPAARTTNRVEAAQPQSKSTAPATRTVNRFEAAQSPGKNDADVRRTVLSESRVQTEPANRSREAPVETETSIANRGRFFSPRPGDASRALKPESPQSQNQQPTAESYVESPSRSRIARVSVPGPAPLASAESYVKFDDQITSERLSARRAGSAAFPEVFPVRNQAPEIFNELKRTPEFFSDLKKDYWPTLPPAPAFDLADDLSARETEAETLRRLEQEQRGTLWSE